jgi:hypothetical protein
LIQTSDSCTCELLAIQGRMHILRPLPPRSFQTFIGFVLSIEKSKETFTCSFFLDPYLLILSQLKKKQKEMTAQHS